LDGRVAATGEQLTGQVICSSKGCRAPATSALVWNNPTLHTPGREKLWHACDDHLNALTQFLDLRGFLRRVDPC